MKSQRAVRPPKPGSKITRARLSDAERGLDRSRRKYYDAVHAHQNTQSFSAAGEQDKVLRKRRQQNRELATALFGPLEGDPPEPAALRTAEEERARADAAQHELLRLANVGLNGTALLALAHQVGEACELLSKIARALKADDGGAAYKKGTR